jgi:hypothetical protein
MVYEWGSSSSSAPGVEMALKTTSAVPACGLMGTRSLFTSQAKACCMDGEVCLSLVLAPGGSFVQV